MTICRHCHSRKSNRPRGLCWRCYDARSVRDRYFTRSKFSRRGVGLGNIQPRSADRPSGSFPGSEEKVAEMERRAAMEMELWHPEDAER